MQKDVSSEPEVALAGGNMSDVIRRGQAVHRTAGPWTPALLTVVAVGVFASWVLEPVLVLAVLFALGIWVVGQNFGALATGQATDPNSGLPLALLAVTFWPVAAAKDPPRTVAA